MDALAESMDESIEQMSIGSKTWKQNFKEAMNCTGDGGEPSMMDYAMHFLSFFWKVLFAIVPPTRYLSGWLTFVCSLIFIGILTGFIGVRCCMRIDAKCSGGAHVLTHVWVAVLSNNWSLARPFHSIVPRV